MQQANTKCSYHVDLHFDLTNVPVGPLLHAPDFVCVAANQLRAPWQQHTQASLPNQVGAASWQSLSAHFVAHSCMYTPETNPCFPLIIRKLI